MSSKHTPGPWFPVQYSSGGWEINVADSGWSQTLASAHVNEFIPIDRATAEANARLIAAAPELLDALRNLVAVQPNLMANSAEIADAHAAIAKAGGAS